MMWKHIWICMLLCGSLSVPVAFGGDYAQSAHGDQGVGVLRSSMPAAYTKGNCGHCHLQHASVAGTEDSANGFALFSGNFSGKARSPYTQEDNFCFQCHTTSSSQQQGEVLVNHDYAETFGGYDEGSDEGILEQFNHTSGVENSYHNLEDIQNYTVTNFPSWFKADSNPCVACHNPHRARRNKVNVAVPTYTAISLPSEHESLWGDENGETMAKYSDYQAPYYYNSSNTYEPGGLLTSDPSKVPDYSFFCNNCHDANMPTIYSTSLTRDLNMIDWSAGAGGDKHGQSARTGETWLREPYASGNKSNYVLSCLDCHEPHGSPYPFLIRRSINGQPLHLTSDVNDGRGNQCRQCHKDDSLLGTGSVNDWKLQHHGQGDLSPYGASQVSGCGCHYAEDSDGGGGRPPAIRCEICHFHGSFVPNPAGQWPATVPLKKGGTRKTF